MWIGCTKLLSASGQTSTGTGCSESKGYSEEMGKGKVECAPCQPCVVCDIPLENAAFSAAVVYLILGLALMTTSAYYVSRDSGANSKIVAGTAIFLVCTVIWLVASVILLIGVLKRNLVLINLFLVTFLILHLFVLCVGIIYTLEILASERCGYRKKEDGSWTPAYCGFAHWGITGLVQAFYYAPVMMALIGWYLYWIVYAFYLENGGTSWCTCHSDN